MYMYIYIYTYIYIYKYKYNYTYIVGYNQQHEVGLSKDLGILSRMINMQVSSHVQP